jgi:hypothetical protein
MLRDVLLGAIAGAAGTAALNITTYLDMTVRARPASSVPATVAGKLADRTGIDSLSNRSGDETTQNRQSGAGALLGYAAGLGLGALYGAVRPYSTRVPLGLAGTSLGLAAMATSDVPIAALDVSDPRTWGAADWLSDLIPHLIYGIVTVATYETLSRQ